MEERLLLFQQNNTWQTESVFAIKRFPRKDFTNSKTLLLLL